MFLIYLPLSAVDRMWCVMVCWAVAVEVGAAPRGVAYASISAATAAMVAAAAGGCRRRGCAAAAWVGAHLSDEQTAVGRGYAAPAPDS